MNLELSKDELVILEELLTKEAKELPIEIHHTRTNDFKDYLKEKQSRIENLLERVKKLQ